MKVLHWTRPGNYAGSSFEIFNVRWDKELRKWVETSNPDARWGFRHPTTDEIVALKKRDLSHYGIVNEIEAPTIEIQTRVEMGTPTLHRLWINDEEE